MNNHAMLDCETLGVGNSPVLLSIACAIFLNDGTIVAKAHYHIRMSDTEPNGDYSADTILWWMGQSEEARNSILDGQETSFYIDFVLQQINEFIQEHKPATVWSYGATADLKWLRSAYNRVFRSMMPWSYRQERCLRTVANMFDPFGSLRQKPTIKHNALADAESQVKWLTRMSEVRKFVIR